MPDLWMPGATRVPGNNGLRQGVGGGRGLCFFTWHTFEAPYTYSPDGIAAMRYLHSRGSTAHFVFHPVTGAIVQGLPADQAARTLRVNDNAGNFADVNRHGDIHMQVEVIAYAKRPWTLDLTDDAGRASLARLMDYLRSWGIPDQWAWKGQAPPAYPGGSVRRRWPEQSGHAYHSGWPVNDHGDPGAIAAPWTISGGTGPDPSPPTSNAGFTTDHVRAVQADLNTLGYGPLDVDGSLGPLTQAAVTAYQTDHGLDPDGLPGPATTASLEDTMSTLPDQVAAAVWGRTMARAGGTDPVRADTILRYAAHRSQVDSLAAQVATLAGRVEALTEAAGQTGTPDLAAVETAAARGAERVLAGYRLTLERAETETEEDA